MSDLVAATFDSVGRRRDGALHHLRALRGGVPDGA